MSLLDSWGESLGGISDSIVSGGQSFIDGWFQSQTDKVVDAAPEHHRPAIKDEPAQQPSGQPVYQPQRHMGNFDPSVMLTVSLVMVVLLCVTLMFRGK